MAGLRPAPGTSSARPEGRTAHACAECGAALRPGAPWCTLCLQPVAGRLQPVAGAPAVTAPAPAPAFDPLTAPLAQVLGGPAPPSAGWPCTTCGELNALADARCAACGAAFLAPLASALDRGWVLPVVGDVSRLSPGERTALALGVAVAVVLLVALLGTAASLVG